MSLSTSSKRFSDPSLNGHNGTNGHHHYPLQPITNYPEHLNPFYKDENHKRIRFLKVLPKKLNLTSSSSSSDKSKSGASGNRRSSFSFEGMRDMWKLRPFRSSNKKPMSLTVTKTSESPPQLRRDLTITDVPFERNNRVRASMQEMRGNPPGSGIYGSPQNENNNFLRNSRYRNTMAAGPVSTISSPVTMRQRYSNQAVVGGGMKPGSSELSVRSTNPFDEDDNYDDGMSVSGMSVSSMPNRPYRKKRRAPLPPINSNKTDDDKSETSINPRVIVTSPSTESGTTEQVEMTDRTTVEIQNIATELDAMIRRTESSDSVDKGTEKKVEQVKVVEEDKEIKETVGKETVDIVEDKVEEKISQKPLAKPRELIRKDAVEESSQTGAQIVTITTSTTKTVQTVAKKKKNRSGSSDALRIVESEDEESEVIPITIRSFDDSTQETTSTKTLENGSAGAPTGSTATVYENSAVPYKNGVVETDKYDIRFVPLKSSEETVPETEPTTTATATGGKPKTVNVKDIIESINKSQSLLKINYEDHQRRTSNGSINTRIRELERKETEINEMLNEIDLDRKVNGLCTSRTDDQIVEEEINAIPVVIRDLESQISREEDSGSLFQKCRPVSLQQHQNRPLSGDHDWNPLPKPKRSSPTTSPTK